MYSTNSELIEDLDAVKRNLFSFLKGETDLERELENFGSLLWPAYCSLVEKEHLETNSTRFYLVYGYACLVTNKAVLSFSITDIDSAVHYVNQTRASAYK